jgi:hypothetical protein
MKSCQIQDPCLFYPPPFRNEVGVGGWVYTWFKVSVYPSIRPCSVFRTLFFIRYADAKMKLGMIVYNNELQIEFRFYWLIFDRVMAFGLRIFMKISVSRTFFELILQKSNLVWLLTIMSYRSSLSFVVNVNIWRSYDSWT